MFKVEINDVIIRFDRPVLVLRIDFWHLQGSKIPDTVFAWDLEDNKEYTTPMPLDWLIKQIKDKEIKLIKPKIK